MTFFFAWSLIFIRLFRFRRAWKLAALTRFFALFFSQVVFPDNSRVRYSKHELSKMLLTNEQEKSLEDNDSWNLYISISQYRLLITINFLIDVQFEVAQLSLRFQSNQVTPSDILSAIDTCLVQLQRMLIEDGNQLAEFLKNFDSRQSSYHGIPLSEVESGRNEFDKDRKDIIHAARVFIRYIYFEVKLLYMLYIRCF